MTLGYQFGRFELRPATRQLLVDQQPATLGARAFDLLLALLERRDRLVTKDELLELVWPGLVVEENNLQVQVSALRKLLGPEAIATDRRPRLPLHAGAGAGRRVRTTAAAARRQAQPARAGLVVHRARTTSSRICARCLPTAGS